MELKLESNNNNSWNNSYQSVSFAIYTIRRRGMNIIE